MSTRRTRPLRIALAANLLLSTATGLPLSTSSADVATWLGAVAPWLVLSIGLGLLAFAGLIVAVLRRPRPVLALAISVADVLWVLATIPLLFVPDLLSAPGKVAVAVVAALVGALAVAQMFGIRTMLRDRVDGRGRYRHCLRVPVDVPPSRMWEVIADLGGIERFSPTISSSLLRDGAMAGVGAVRECSNPRGQVWAEQCEVFDPARRRLDLRFRVEEEGFPFPVRTMVGGWKVFEDGAGSVVEVWWSLTPTTRPGWLVTVLLGLQVDRDMVGAIGRMAEAAQGRPVPATPPRLQLAWC